MKSKRKKIRTEGCSDDEVDIMAKMRSMQTQEQQPSTLWPSGLVGDFKCHVSSVLSNQFVIMNFKEGNYYVQFENLCDDHADCIDGSDETEGTYLV